jgi:hypothetical protein
LKKFGLVELQVFSTFQILDDFSFYLILFPELGEFQCDLDGTFSAIRTRETNLGNFICDIMVKILSMFISWDIFI